MATKRASKTVVKPEPKLQQFTTLADALDFIEGLARKKPKVTGYLNVGLWSVRWEEKQSG